MSNHLTRFSPSLDSLDDLLHGFFVRPMEFQTQVNTPSIKVDVKEDPAAYQVHAELPGAKKEDIHVAVEGNTVSISAEIKQEKEVKEGERVLRSERYFGKVARSFQLAQEIDDAAAVAKFTDGVLELTLPKKASATSKRLEIQ